MKRRTVMLGAASLALATKARANTVRLGMSALGPILRSWVAQPILVQQKCPEWCWAASCSMIFETNGHQIDQQTIVNAVFNNPMACSPALPGIVGNVLSGTWTDANGMSFQSIVTAAYDSFDGIDQMTNNIVINELNSNRPLLYANSHHAMVVVQADYIQTPLGPNVQAVYVLDPWPLNQSFRQLSGPEATQDNHHFGPYQGQMAFLASVQII